MTTLCPLVGSYNEDLMVMVTPRDDDNIKFSWRGPTLLSICEGVLAELRALPDARDAYRQNRAVILVCFSTSAAAQAARQQVEEIVQRHLDTLPSQA